MSKKLVIVGGGGHAREIIWLAQEVGNYDVLGVLDDNLPVGSQVGDSHVLGQVLDANQFLDAQFILAIGSSVVRKLVAEKLSKFGVFSFATLVHPSVKISPTVEVGAGSMLCANSVVTVDIKIAQHCLINIGATISHDCQLGAFSTLGPRASLAGNVKLGECAEVGLGATVKQGLKLGENGFLGMGAVLIRDLDPGQVFVGNPARPIKRGSRSGNLK